jgi:hypothetical protein
MVSWATSTGTIEVDEQQKQTSAVTADDDARWLPLTIAHKRRAEQTGDARLAAIDLTEALAGRVHCRYRSATDRKLVAPVAWREQIMLEAWSDGVRVVHRPDPNDDGRRGGRIVKPVRDLVFYVWDPDLDDAWPPNTALTAPSLRPDDPPRITKQTIIGRIVDLRLYSAGLPSGITPATLKTQCDPLWKAECGACRVPRSTPPDRNTYRQFIKDRQKGRR